MSNSAITGPVFTDVRRSPSGSAAAPSWSFADSTGTGVYLASTDVLALSTAGVQRVVVDAAGNVGIGGAPTGQANFKTFELGTTGVSGLIDVLQEGARQLRIYNSSTNAVISNSTNGGATAFITTDAGGVASERLRIDGSGNVGIGTVSPETKLHISYGLATGDYISTGGTNRNQNGLNKIFKFKHGYWAGTQEVASIGVATTSSTSGNGYGFGDLVFHAGSSGNGDTGSTSAERMRIHSSGKIENRTGLPIVTGGADALTAAFDVTQTTIPYGGYGTALHWQSVTPGGYRQHASLGSWRPASSGWGSVFLGVGQNDNALTRFYLFTSDGNAFQANNSSTWSTTSDVRIKQNVRPVNNSLQKITELKPVHFEYVDKAEQIKTGFIAQEFEKVLPGHVHEVACPEDIAAIKPELKDEKIKSIDADLIPYLVGAIKELKAELDEAKAKIAALEAK